MGNCGVEDGSGEGDGSMVDRCVVEVGSTAEEVSTGSIMHRNTPYGQSVYVT